MNCPIERGGCGKKLAWEDGAFCETCMQKAIILKEIKKREQEKEG